MTSTAWIERQLATLVGHPTVSASPTTATTTTFERCAAWLAALLRRAGVPEAEVVRGPGRPYVLGRWDVGPRAPTLLLYAHYDVQPPGAQRWRHDPFSLQLRAGAAFGRGVADDKGPLLAIIDAVRRSSARRGRPPVNLRFLFDGEEEVGSPSIAWLVTRRAADLRADALVVCDTNELAGRPTLTLSCRGEVTADLEVRSRNRTLHAGRFGGTTLNPAAELCRALGSMTSPDGRVVVTGFRRGVQPLPTHGSAVDDAALRSVAATPFGEPGRSTIERGTTLPALVVTALDCGAPIVGPQHSIQQRALAQVNARLVHAQDPHEIASALHDHVRRTVHPALDVRARTLLAILPFRTRDDGPAARAADAASRRVLGRTLVRVRSGGTIAPLPALAQLIPDAALIGFGATGDRAHGTDERIDLRRLGTASDLLTELLARYPLIFRRTADRGRGPGREDA